MTVANTHAAISLLARALFGIGETGRMEPNPDPDEPDLSMSEIDTDGDEARAKVHLPSGDTYSVAVRWLREESP